MRTLSEIEADLVALNRPRLENFVDALALARGGMKDFAARRDAWDRDNPGGVGRWRELRVEYDNAARAEEARKAAVAEATRMLGRLEETVGSKAVEAIPAALRQPHDGMRAALAFEGSKAWCLTLLGGVGTGKTVPAAYLAKRTLEAGGKLVWWRAASIATSSLFGIEAAERDKRAAHADLLVVDDLGSEMTTGPWVAILENVLGYRYANAAKTVVTGNLLLESVAPDGKQNPNVVTLRSLLKDRLFDRIREGVVVGTGTGSLRRKSA